MSPGPALGPITKEFVAIFKSARLKEEPQQKGEKRGVNVVVTVHQSVLSDEYVTPAEFIQKLKELFPPPSKYRTCVSIMYQRSL